MRCGATRFGFKDQIYKTYFNALMLPSLSWPRVQCFQTLPPMSFREETEDLDMSLSRNVICISIAHGSCVPLE